MSHLTLPQPGRPGPRIYIPQEKGGPITPPATSLSQPPESGPRIYILQEGVQHISLVRGFLLVASYNCRVTVEISEPASTQGNRVWFHYIMNV
jgi:hypothetical protein